jgi:hypothetical protein
LLNNIGRKDFSKAECRYLGKGSRLAALSYPSINSLRDTMHESHARIKIACLNPESVKLGGKIGTARSRRGPHENPKAIVNGWILPYSP